MDTVELLHATIAALANDEPLPEPAKKWLYQGFRDHEAGAPLESAFRLTQRDRIAARNKALNDAAAALDADTTWKQAQLLEKAIARFEARVWPRVRYQQNPSLPPVDAALFRAFKSGARPLRCARKLYELIR
jgi:hypothetical protein